MRKITKLTQEAWRAGRNFKLRNTQVEVVGRTRRLYLHGNLIAEFKDGELRVTLAGWNTPTTRERLKAVGVVAWTHKGQAFIDGMPVSSYDWHKIENA